MGYENVLDASSDLVLQIVWGLRVIARLVVLLKVARLLEVDVKIVHRIRVNAVLDAQQRLGILMERDRLFLAPVPRFANPNLKVLGSRDVYPVAGRRITLILRLNDLDLDAANTPRLRMRKVRH